MEVESRNDFLGEYILVRGHARATAGEKTKLTIDKYWRAMSCRKTLCTTFFQPTAVGSPAVVYYSSYRDPDLLHNDGGKRGSLCVYGSHF